jgi:hypothetical protein
MSVAPVPGSAAELLTHLATAVALNAVCLPAAVRRAEPGLEAAVDELGLAATPRPAGDEDLLCLVAGGSVAETLNEAEHALRHFRTLPFVLILPRASEPTGALQAAAELVSQSSPWLAQRSERDDGPALLAPDSRVLSEPSLPGQWSAAPAAGALDSEPAALGVVWEAAQRDQRSLARLADRIEDGERRLEETRGARERLSGEVARLRAAERREVDRLRLAAMEERAWVAEQALRIEQSTSWRVGHRLVRIGRRLTFRGDRGTNLPARIADRMQDGELP